MATDNNEPRPRVATDQYVKLIGMGKAHIDKGFSKVGRVLKADDPAHNAMTGLASRAIAIANAIALLGLNNHANEALPLLRSLFEISLHMSSIAKEGRPQAEGFIAEYAKPDWASFMPSQGLAERARRLGYPEGLAEKILSACRPYLHANAAGVPWGHVFAKDRPEGISAEDVMQTTALVMGHVVKALDLQWGEFAGAEDIWRAAQAAEVK